MSNNTNHKGRTKTTRFTRLEHTLLHSPAYRALSPNGRALLVELATMENGSNNGELFLSVRDAAARMGVTDTTAATAAFNELEAMGFIACTREAHFAVKAGTGSRARCWRLTWQSTPALRQGPTMDFHGCRPEPNSRADKRMIAGNKALKSFRHDQSKINSAVAESATLNPERVAKSDTTKPNLPPQDDNSVWESATRFSGNGGNQPKPVVWDSATHTADQLGANAEEPTPARPFKGQGPSDGVQRNGDNHHCEECGEGFDRSKYGDGDSIPIGKMAAAILARAVA